MNASTETSGARGLGPLRRLLTFAQRRGWRRTLARVVEEAGDWGLRRLTGASRYERWFAEQQRRAASVVLPEGITEPTISVLMPVCDPDPKWLEAAIDSVRNQRYAAWQLCMVDDGSTRPEIRSLLIAAAESDPRIVVQFNAQRAGISRTSNRALQAATGDWVALLDHDDELTPDALLQVAVKACEEPFDILYSDEDKIAPGGGLRDPVFKPDRCRDFLHSCMYFGHLTVYRRALVETLGGFDGDFDGSQDYELALRAEAVAETVIHLPQVLYHWRMAEGSAANPNEDAKPWAYAAGRRAREAAIQRTSDRARIVDGVVKGHARVVRAVRPGARLSIVYCECCLSPASQQQGIPGGEESAIAVDWVPITAEPDRPKGVGERWNDAAARAKGDLLVFLEGVRPMPQETGPPWWLEGVAQLQRSSVGVVGGQISTRAGRLLHAGVVLGGKTILRTELPGLHRDEPGHLAMAQSLREVSAVTGGCLGIRRTLLEEMGGFRVDFMEGLHDVDLCLRLRTRAERVIYDPYFRMERVDTHRLVTAVGVSGALAPPHSGDLTRLVEKWPWIEAESDPFSNPSFHSEGPIFQPAFRPR